MADLVLDRIRILKTGLFGVERYLDMSDPANVAYFERLAEPGTHLTLRRVKNHPEDPFRIEVFGPEGWFLGRVTAAKNETAARLMDAGLPLAPSSTRACRSTTATFPRALRTGRTRRTRAGTRSPGSAAATRTAICRTASICWGNEGPMEINLSTMN